MQILFGVLALIFGLAGCIMLGVIGFGITLVLAVLAFVFSSKAKKSERSGAPGLVMGILGLVFGIICTLVMVGVAGVAEEEAKKLNLPILSECSAALKFGVVGLVFEIADHQYDLDALNAEIDQLKDGIEKTTTTEAVTSEE